MVTKLRIGVLMGGKSIEREVSFNSGRTICDHLDTQRYTIVPLFQTVEGVIYLLPQHFLHRGKIDDFINRLEQEAEHIAWDNLKRHVDFVYLAIHGRYAEDGTIQGMLEVMKIPYLGAKVLGSALGMSKSMQKLLLKSHDFDVPKGITLRPHEQQNVDLNTIITNLENQDISFPVIVKPAHEGSSLGIQVVSSPHELLPAIQKAGCIDARRQQDVLIEEKLNGIEFVCVSLEKISNNDNTITRSWFSLPITEVVIEDNSHIFDYEQKYMPGRALKITPARCSDQQTKKVQAICEKAATVLQFATISRIDGFITDDERIVIIDPNSLTGMSPSTFLFNQAAEFGMSHTDLINFLIENELKSYNIINDLTWLPAHKGNTMTTQDSKKIRIGILLGGDSNEREISLESGRNVCYKLSPHKYDVLPIFVNDQMELFKLSQKLLIKNTTRTITQLVRPEDQIQWSDLPTLCDFVFIALHGGKGENGAVQGTLEMLDLPYNGPEVLTNALCIDKFKTNNFLRSQGFHVPINALISKTLWLEVANKQAFVDEYLKQHNLTIPVIVKPHDDGCSVMVYKTTTLTELVHAIDTILTTKSAALLEEFIIGKELTVGVLGNDALQALPPSMAVAQHGILSTEEKFLPGAGENQTPAPLSNNVLEHIKKTIIDAFKAVGGTGYSRIDCFYQTASESPTGEERVVILEFNTLPALTPATCLFHQAAEIGMKPMDLIDSIIELGFERHRTTHRTTSHQTDTIKPATTISQKDSSNETETLINNTSETSSMHNDHIHETKSAAAHDELVFMKLF